jgi:hypothetical protein
MPALVGSHKQPLPTVGQVPRLSMCYLAEFECALVMYNEKPYYKGYCAIDIRHGGCTKATDVVGNKESDHRKGKSQIYPSYSVFITSLPTIHKASGLTVFHDEADPSAEPAKLSITDLCRPQCIPRNRKCLESRRRRLRGCPVAMDQGW